MTFAFGIVNYNGGEALLECIASILALSGPPAAVIVFDNASADGSAEAVEREFPGVRVMRSERNLGYAGALNRMLREMTAEVVVLCNMDLRFDPAWRLAVEDALSGDPDAAGVASLVLEMTDPPLVNSTGVRLYPDLHPQNVGSGTPFQPRALAPRAWSPPTARSCASAAPPSRSWSSTRTNSSSSRRPTSSSAWPCPAAASPLWPAARVYHHRSLTTAATRRSSSTSASATASAPSSSSCPSVWPVSFAYSLRRLWTLRTQAPAPGTATADGAPGAARIVWTILRAWCAAVLRLPGTLRERGPSGRPAPPPPATPCASSGRTRSPRASSESADLGVTQPGRRCRARRRAGTTSPATVHSREAIASDAATAGGTSPASSRAIAPSLKPSPPGANTAR